MVCDRFITSKLVNNHQNDQKGPSTHSEAGRSGKAMLIVE